MFYQRVYIGKPLDPKTNQGYPLGLVPGWPDTQETSMADSETLIPLHEALRRNARNHPACRDDRSDRDDQPDGCDRVVRRGR